MSCRRHADGRLCDTSLFRPRARPHCFWRMPVTEPHTAADAQRHVPRTRVVIVGAGLLGGSTPGRAAAALRTCIAAPCTPRPDAAHGETTTQKKNSDQKPRTVGTAGTESRGRAQYKQSNNRNPGARCTDGSTITMLCASKCEAMPSTRTARVLCVLCALRALRRSLTLRCSVTSAKHSPLQFTESSFRNDVSYEFSRTTQARSA